MNNLNGNSYIKSKRAIYFNFNFFCNGCEISKCLGILTKAKKVLNKSSLFQLYYLFMYPYLCYCIEACGSTYNTHLTSLYNIQKRASNYIISPHKKLY